MALGPEPSGMKFSGGYCWQTKSVPNFDLLGRSVVSTFECPTHAKASLQKLLPENLRPSEHLCGYGIFCSVVIEPQCLPSGKCSSVDLCGSSEELLFGGSYSA